MHRGVEQWEGKWAAAGSQFLSLIPNLEGHSYALDLWKPHPPVLGIMGIGPAI